MGRETDRKKAKWGEISRKRGREGSRGSVSLRD